MKTYKYKTLDRAFLLLILPLVITITIILFIFFQTAKINDQYRALSDFLKFEVSQLSQSLSEPLWKIDENRIMRIAETSLTRPSIVGIRISDETSNQYISLGITEVEYKQEMPELTFIKELGFITRSISSKSENLHYYSSSAPIIFKTDVEEMTIGRIRLFISDEKLLEDTFKDLIYFFLLSFSLSTLYLIGIILIHRYIVTKPLKELKSSLQDAIVADHDGEIFIIEETGNEILYLKNTFDRLWSRQSELIQQIKESETYYRELLNSLPIGLILTELDGKIIEVNFTLKEILGFTDKELIDKSIWDLCTNECLPEKREILKKFEDNDSIKSSEVDFVKKDGEIINVSLNERVVRRNERSLILASLEDITSEKMIQEALVKSEQFLQETDAIAKIGGWELNLLSSELFWTEQVFLIHEVSQDFVPNLENAINFYHPQDLPVIQEAVESAMNNGKSFNVEARVITAKDNEIWVLAIGHAIEENGRIVSIRGTFQDITNQKNREMESIELERLLNHKSKIDILGHLASGVAHDFNNILAGILNSAHLLSMKAKLDESLQKYIEIIMQSSENGTRLANKLLTFSRIENYNKENTSINDLISGSIDILRTIMDKKIVLKYNKSEKEYFAHIDYSSLQNALVNIGINSSHAMPDGGEILINLEEVFLSHDYCKNSGYAISPGNYVNISIIDNGHGMAKSIQERIFDPFFTTKEEGKGTGLGLAAVKRTIIESHGEVKVSSSPQKGTTIFLLLPISEKGIKIITNKKENEEHKGSGLILFVDDEEINRITGQDLLESFGYEVIVASNGREALNIYLNNHKSIKLVILDMIMPIMDGEEAFRKMKEFRSETPILLCSGYSKSEKVIQLLEEGLDGVISKPFNIQELTKTISDYMPGH